MSTFDPDEWQETVNAPRPQDDTPVPVRYFNLVKCAAIVDAYTQGQTGYKEAARDVAYYLQLCALEATRAEYVQPRPAEIWPRIADVPWPLAGGPRPQPDTTNFPDDL